MLSLHKGQLSSFMLHSNIHIFPAQWLWYADMGKDRVEKKDISALSSRFLVLRQYYPVIKLLLSRPSCYFWICPFPGFWHQRLTKIQCTSVPSSIKRVWKMLLNMRAKHFLNAGIFSYQWLCGKVNYFCLTNYHYLVKWTCYLFKYMAEFCCDWLKSFYCVCQETWYQQLY